MVNKRSIDMWENISTKSDTETKEPNYEIAKALVKVDTEIVRQSIIGMTCWGEFVKASDIFGKGV